MPKIDFRPVSGVADFAPLPDGEFLGRLIDIEIDRTKSGDEMWKLKWQVEGGEHNGRFLFDNMVFSIKAMPRVKLICSICGLDVSGELDLEPSMLFDKRAMISTYQEEYEDERGQKKLVNRIPFDGYGCVPGDSESTPF